MTAKAEFSPDFLPSKAYTYLVQQVFAIDLLAVDQILSLLMSCFVSNQYHCFAT